MVESLTAEPVPSDWAKKTDMEKEEWLAKHPLPGDPSVSLFSCWLRGQKIGDLSQLISKLLVAISGSLADGTHSSTVMDVFNKLVTAFDDGLVVFTNTITHDCNYLKEHGMFPQDTPVTHLKDLEDTPPVPLISSAGGHIPEHTFMTYLRIAIEFFIKGLEQVPGWNKVNPQLKIPISAIVKGFVEAAKDFAREWDKSKSS